MWERWPSAGLRRADWCDASNLLLGITSKEKAQGLGTERYLRRREHAEIDGRGTSSRADPAAGWPAGIGRLAGGK